MKYKRITTEREAPLVMTVWEATKWYNRLVELEDKIENGELIDRDEYIDRLMAAKDISGMTDKELEFFAKHNVRVRKQTIEECVSILRDIDSPGIVEPFWIGWGEAINAAIKEIQEEV